MIGDLDEPLLVAVGAGKRTAQMPEQLGLEEGFWKRTAVDGHERSGSSRRVGVDRPRNELLPRPRFACDQDGAVRWSHSVDPILQLPDGRAVAENVGEVAGTDQRLLEHRVLFFEPTVFERFVDLDLSARRRRTACSGSRGPPNAAPQRRTRSTRRP